MRRILVIQNGDYAEAYDRFAAGGEETYRDQRASVKLFADMTPRDSVTTVAIGVPEHDRLLAPNLRSVGMPDESDRAGPRDRLVDREEPTHVILRTPHLGFARSVARRQAHVLPMFADLFSRGGPRGRLRTFMLRRALHAARVPCVANHGLNASRSLVAVLGYAPERVVPWEQDNLSLDGPPKPAPDAGLPLRLFYVGSLRADKGVGDLLAAVALLKGDGLDIEATIVGGGDVEPWRAEAGRLGVDGAVTFPGLLPNADVRSRMAAHDVVVVPSRHEYPEGLPNSIAEGLASRSAVVISDHPAFRGRVSEGACLVFRAGDARDMARQIARLRRDPSLYVALSSGSEAALAKLPFGLPWFRLIHLFLDDPEDRTGWVGANSLATMLAARPAPAAGASAP